MRRRADQAERAMGAGGFFEGWRGGSGAVVGMRSIVPTIDGWVSARLGGDLEDYARAALPGEIGERPFEEHVQAAAVVDDAQQVHAQPQLPGDYALELEAADLGDRPVAADRGHLAPVYVPEGPAPASPEIGADHARDVAAALHRQLRHPGERHPLLRLGYEVAHDEDLAEVGTERSSSTHTRPARSSGTPRWAVSELARTPTAHSTVRVGMTSSPSSTWSGPMSATTIPVRISMPNRSRSRFA